ncbi:MAG: C39 family peptidase [Verrucomicrobiia bacterium]
MKEIKKILLIVGSFLLLLNNPSHAKILNLPQIKAEQTYWCWAAVSQSILSYYGINVTQQEIANYGAEGQNTPNLFSGSREKTRNKPAFNGIDLILQNFSGPSTYYKKDVLSLEELKNEIENNRPVIIRWESTHYGEGGHFVILYGIETNTVYIMDSRETISKLPYDDVVGSPDFYWSSTLTLKSSIDVAFVIDSTGSMKDDVQQVIANVQTILHGITNKFNDYRISVVDYQDNPKEPWGLPGDYFYQVRTPLTADIFFVQNAFASIQFGDGGDPLEAINTALAQVIQGDIIGGWRRGLNVKRSIILMGDAAGHDPEPWAPYYSSGELIQAAIANDVDVDFRDAKPRDAIANTAGPISIYGLVIGDNSGTYDYFSRLAYQTGGDVVAANSSDDITASLGNLIDIMAAKKRYPNDLVMLARPHFRWDNPPVPMDETPKRYYLALEKQNKHGKWKKMQRIKLKEETPMDWMPQHDIKVGIYRWRLGMKLRKGGIQWEADWTEFSRLPVVPGKIAPETPTGLIPSKRRGAVTYRWPADFNANRYKLLILRNGKKWRKKTVRIRKKRKDDTIIETTLRGHRSEKKGLSYDYSWMVQGLNKDTKKPLDDNWSEPLFFQIEK